jgi:hypothetical protein
MMLSPPFLDGAWIEPRPPTCKASALTLEPFPQPPPFFFFFFLRESLVNFAQADLELTSHLPCLPNSWGYRYVLPQLACHHLLRKELKGLGVKWFHRKN